MILAVLNKVQTEYGVDCCLYSVLPSHGTGFRSPEMLSLRLSGSLAVHPWMYEVSQDPSYLLDQERKTQKGVKLASHTVRGGMRCLASYERYIHSANSNKIHTKLHHDAPSNLSEFFNSLTAVSTSSNVNADTAQRACFCAN